MAQRWLLAQGRSQRTAQQPMPCLFVLALLEEWKSWRTTQGGMCMPQNWHVSVAHCLSPMWSCTWSGQFQEVCYLSLIQSNPACPCLGCVSEFWRQPKAVHGNLLSLMLMWGGCHGELMNPVFHLGQEGCRLFMVVLPLHCYTGCTFQIKQ